MNTPEAIAKREDTKRKNLQSVVEHQVSLEYKKSKGLDTRVKTVFVDRYITVYDNKRLPHLDRAINTDRYFLVDKYLSNEQQDWLRTLVRERGHTRDGVLFRFDIITALDEKFDVQLSRYLITHCMTSLSLEFVQFVSGYYREMIRRM